MFTSPLYVCSTYSNSLDLDFPLYIGYAQRDVSNYLPYLL